MRNIIEILTGYRDFSTTACWKNLHIGDCSSAVKHRQDWAAPVRDISSSSAAAHVSSQDRVMQTSSARRRQSATSVSTGWAKKLAPFFLYALTLPNINRFSKLFHCQNQEKIRNNTITKYPTTPQVCRYTTLWNVSVLKATIENKTTYATTRFKTLIIHRKHRVYCLSYCLK